MSARILIRLRAASIAASVAALLLIQGCATAQPGGPTFVQAPPTPAVEVVPLPNQANSFKFAVLGDFGNGSSAQYQLAEQMFKTHGTFPFGVVLLTGDNIYGSERPQDFVSKFETPYKPLLDAKVRFFASLGNHDSREQRSYRLFNMNGELYYTFNPSPDIRFFALESTYMEPEQVAWLERELKASSSDWKIVYLHHPLYSSGERHGSDLRLRAAIEPLFVTYNVSVVFAGHDHFYERVMPQKGILHFVIGSGGQLRRGNIDRSTGITARGFDTDLAFLVGEIMGDQMTFQAISRTGAVVDSGSVTRRKPAEGPAQATTQPTEAARP